MTLDIVATNNHRNNKGDYATHDEGHPFARDDGPP